MASLVALLLFLMVVVASAVAEPITLTQGIVVKIPFTLALVGAVKAGAEERSMMRVSP